MLRVKRIGQRLVKKEQDSAQFWEDRTVLSEKREKSAKCKYDIQAEVSTECRVYSIYPTKG